MKPWLRLADFHPEAAFFRCSSVNLQADLCGVAVYASAQLLHVGCKVAAEMGDAYLTALDQAASRVSKNVTENLLQRHIMPLFL